ncbi:MAG TPA: ABC transporter permease [Rhodopila sp.]|uniref:ABC transporter permease n=1 Tax=Rhodopila sp. TaxID=2480087 RepID=UPI002BEF2718|nr:ABC transporter permease [Rhodopila sp.]HVY16339.1 ABC transporter permease [Rhodopila sp.]
MIGAGDPAGELIGPRLMVALPAAFLLLFFVIPNAFLLTTSFLKSEDQVLTNQVTLQNFTYLLTKPIYLTSILRSFWISALTGMLVVLLAYPLAYYLARTANRWRGLLIGIALAPLLASVVVRTYGWWVILNRDGPISDLARAFALSRGPLVLLPSSLAIVVGLTHALLPYGVLTILSAINGINPSLERAAMSLGANRCRTFLTVTLPLSIHGIAGAFLLAFSLSVSAYATPAILGGPATATMATRIYDFLTSLDDWSLGAAMAAILIVTTMLILFVGSAVGARRASL